MKGLTLLMLGTLLLCSACAHAGQVYTLSGLAATNDVDSTNCASAITTPAGQQSIMRWLYRQNGAFLRYDSLGVILPGARWTMPSVWLPSGRYYDVVANRDSGGVTPCPIVRWFTVRGFPLPPVLDPLPTGQN